MKVLLVRPDPVAGNFSLCCREVELTLAHQIAQPILKLILDLRVPLCVAVGMWPQIVNVVGAAQCRRNQIIHFVGLSRGVGDAVLCEYAMSDRCVHCLVLRPGFLAHLYRCFEKCRARSQRGVGGSQHNRGTLFG